MGSCCSSAKAVEVIGCQTENLPIAKPTTSETQTNEANAASTTNTGTDPDTSNDSGQGSTLLDSRSASPNRAQDNSSGGVGEGSDYGSEEDELLDGGSGVASVPTGGSGYRSQARRRREASKSGNDFPGYGQSSGSSFGGGRGASGSLELSRRGRDGARVFNNKGETASPSANRVVTPGKTAAKRRKPVKRSSTWTPADEQQQLDYDGGEHRERSNTFTRSDRGDSASSRRSFSRHLPDADLEPNPSAIGITRSKSLGRNSHRPIVPVVRSQSIERSLHRMPIGGHSVGGGATAYYRTGNDASTERESYQFDNGHDRDNSAGNNLGFGIQGQSATLHDRFGRGDDMVGTARGRSDTARSSSSNQNSRVSNSTRSSDRNRSNVASRPDQNASSQSQLSSNNLSRLKGKSKPPRGIRPNEQFFESFNYLPVMEPVDPVPVQAPRRKRKQKKGTAFTYNFGNNGNDEVVPIQNSDDDDNEVDEDDEEAHNSDDNSELNNTLTRLPILHSYNLTDSLRSQSRECESERQIDGGQSTQYNDSRTTSQISGQVTTQSQSLNTNGRTAQENGVRTNNPERMVLAYREQTTLSIQSGIISMQNGVAIITSDPTATQRNVTDTVRARWQNFDNNQHRQQPAISNRQEQVDPREQVRARWQQFDEQNRKQLPKDNIPIDSNTTDCEGASRLSTNDTNLLASGSQILTPRERRRQQVAVQPVQRDGSDLESQNSNDVLRRKKGSKIPRTIRNTQLDVEALQMHISDLRQLLAQHLAQQGKRSNVSTQASKQPGISMSTGTSGATQSPRQSGTGMSSQARPLGTDMSSQSSNTGGSAVTTQTAISTSHTGTTTDAELIQRFQADIVRLEEQLAAKEEELDRQKQAFAEQQKSASDQNNQTDELSLSLDEEMERALSSLDREFAERLGAAQDEEVSDDEINRILDEHYKNREKLIQKMLDNKEKMKDRLRRRLQERNSAKTEDGLIDGQSDKSGTSRNRNGTFSKDDPNELENGLHDKNQGKQQTSTPSKDDDNISNDESKSDSVVRSRRGTFTKHDDSDNGASGNDSDSNDQKNDDKLHGGSTERKRRGTFSKDDEVGESNDSCDEKQNDTDNRVNDSNKMNKDDGDADELGEFRERSNTFTRPTRSMDGITEEEEPEEKHKVIMVDSSAGMGAGDDQIVNLIDAFSQDCQDMDDKWIQTVWRKHNHGDMSAEELNRLLREHFDSVENLRKKKQAELLAQQQKIKDKLAERKKKMANGRTGADIDDDGDFDNNVEDENDDVNGIDDNENFANDRSAEPSNSSSFGIAMSIGTDTDNADFFHKEVQTSAFHLDRMPVSEDELEELLRRYRQDRRKLLEDQVAASVGHREALKLKLKAKLKGVNTNPKIETNDDSEVGKKVDEDKADESTSDNGDTNSLNKKRVRKERPTTAMKKKTAEEVIQQHKQQVEEMRQKKEEREKEYQDKLQRRLATKINMKKKNDSDSD